MFKKYSVTSLVCALFLAATSLPAAAQTTTGSGTDASTSNTTPASETSGTTTGYRDDRSASHPNYSWIGLVGLLGLAGLMRRRPDTDEMDRASVRNR